MRVNCAGDSVWKLS